MCGFVCQIIKQAEIILLLFQVIGQMEKTDERKWLVGADKMRALSAAVDSVGVCRSGKGLVLLLGFWNPANEEYFCVHLRVFCFWSSADAC